MQENSRNNNVNLETSGCIVLLKHYIQMSHTNITFFGRLQTVHVLSIENKATLQL